MKAVRVRAAQLLCSLFAVLVVLGAYATSVCGVPTVRISVYPFRENGDSITGGFGVMAITSSDVVEVEFYVDDLLKQETDSSIWFIPPDEGREGERFFWCVFNADEYPPGEHVVWVRVRNARYEEAVAQTIVLLNVVSPPLQQLLTLSGFFILGITMMVWRWRKYAHSSSIVDLVKLYGLEMTYALSNRACIEIAKALNDNPRGLTEEEILAQTSIYGLTDLRLHLKALMKAEAIRFNGVCYYSEVDKDTLKRFEEAVEKEYWPSPWL